ncbi:hypothetical protein GQ53DRAFT_820928 [Thozetella sp. PMI_491]|nr:hypothetical protein GQ53DRAFT_820928 [Thozetella sp. PMI_491]
MLSSMRRRLEPTGDNLNPVLQVFTWLLLALTTLLLILRLLVRLFLKSARLFGLEDLLIIAAYVFGVGQSITVILPAGRIFGQASDAIGPEQLRAGIKAGYAGGLLFLIALGCSKLSACVCFLSLSLDQIHRTVTTILIVVITIWTLTAVLASAFQCGAHGPWEGGELHCVNQRSLLNYISIGNIISDVILTAIPVAMIAPMTIPYSTRALLIAIFSSRILAIVATATQLAYIPRLFGPDPTLNGFPYFLATEFVQFASISTACAVYFWPLLRSLRSGHIWADNLIVPSNGLLSSVFGRERGAASPDIPLRQAQLHQDQSGLSQNSGTSAARGHSEQQH